MAETSEPTQVKTQVYDADRIQDFLPHRYPFLLVDRILELEPGKRAVGLKAVTINEPFFAGHFPGKAIMPGVLLIEAMAQVGGMMILAMDEFTGMLAYLVAIDNCRFRKTVVPGDVLISECNLIKAKGNMGKVHCVARVDGQVALEADIMFALVKRCQAFPLFEEQ